MGYLKNHLATLVMGVFAATLSALWPYFNGFAPVLDFIFLMAVAVSWFLVIVLWLAQMSTNYMHGPGHAGHAVSSAPVISAAAEAGSPETVGVVGGDEMESRRSDLFIEVDDLKNDHTLSEEDARSMQQRIDAAETDAEIEDIAQEISRIRSPD